MIKKLIYVFAFLLFLVFLAWCSWQVSQFVFPIDHVRENIGSARQAPSDWGFADSSKDGKGMLAYQIHSDSLVRGTGELGLAMNRGFISDDVST
jgi:hypothetical protein